MIFDTDILIWSQKGNPKAAKLISTTTERCISIQTYMELLQGAKSRQHHQIIKRFLKEFDFTVLPFTQNIGHRASIYVEEYALSHGVGAADALIAATATENNMALSSSNAKHYKMIKDLKLKVFKP